MAKVKTAQLLELQQQKKASQQISDPKCHKIANKKSGKKSDWEKSVWESWENLNVIKIFREKKH